MDVKTGYHHGNAREAIIQSAIAIIEQHGIAKLSLRSVAEQCGLSATACYRHFKNKEQLFVELAKIGYERLACKMQAYISSSAAKYEPKQVLPLLGLAYIDFAVQHRAYFNLMLGTHAVDPVAYPDLKQASEASFNLLDNTIGYGIATGQFKGDSQQLTLQAWAFVHGLASLIMNHILVYEKQTLEKLLLNFTAGLQVSSE